MKTKEELDEFIHSVLGVDNLEYFSEEETIPAIIGVDDETNALIYDYDKLVEGFMEHFRKYDKDADEEDLWSQAEEWIQYNTIRSLPYKDADYVVYDSETNEIIDRFPTYLPKSEIEAHNLADEKGGYVEVVEYVKPQIIHSISEYDDFDITPKYEFNAKEQLDNCVNWVRDWFNENGKDCNAIIGMSGGKDSTIVAAICAKALGPERVIGVAMPEKGQGINGADEICKYLGIKYLYAPIYHITEPFYNTIICDDDKPNVEWSSQSKQNIAPRVRMTMLYALSQTYNGRVANTCNLSEDFLGYSTIYGDAAGSFSPISKFTVTELKEIGRELGLPLKWVDKVPDDGLPNSCPDEEKFGFTYKELDDYIRKDIIPEGYVNGSENQTKLEKILGMYKRNKFKTDILKIPSYNPNLPGEI